MKNKEFMFTKYSGEYGKPMLQITTKKLKLPKEELTPFAMLQCPGFIQMDRTQASLIIEEIKSFIGGNYEKTN